MGGLLRVLISEWNIGGVLIYPTYTLCVVIICVCGICCTVVVWIFFSWYGAKSKHGSLYCVVSLCVCHLYIKRMYKWLQFFISSFINLKNITIIIPLMYNQWLLSPKSWIKIGFNFSPHFWAKFPPISDSSFFLHFRLIPLLGRKFC